MPIRILHVLDNLGWGGMQNGLVNLIHRMDPARFEQIVCSTRHLDEEEGHRFPAERARVVCVGQKGKTSRFQVPALARCIRELKPDIVHSRNWGGTEAVIAGRYVGVGALVHSEHGLDENSVRGEPWRRTAFRRLAFQLADRVLTVSGQLREIHAQRTGFPVSRMTVIHNGVDTARFCPDPQARESARRELGLVEDELCIGCVGSLSPVKDYPTVFRAVEQLAQSPRPWRLVLIGEGPERPRLEQMLAAHPDLRRRVCFLGLSSRIPQLLNALDVYVLSSIIEGISNSLLEAMASGLPVVATATGGNPEVVIDGQSGCLFPVGGWQALAEHLRSLQKDPQQRARLGQEALNRIRSSFSIDTMVRNYQHLYEGLAPQMKSRSYSEAAV